MKETFIFAQRVPNNGHNNTTDSKKGNSIGGNKAITLFFRCFKILSDSVFYSPFFELLFKDTFLELTYKTLPLLIRTIVYCIKSIVDLQTFFFRI